MDKGIHTFPKGICPKVNEIAWLDFELADDDSAVHRFNHYTMKTPQSPEWEKKLDGNNVKMMLDVLNKSWKQHPRKQQQHQ